MGIADQQNSFEGHTVLIFFNRHTPLRAHTPKPPQHQPEASAAPTNQLALHETTPAERVEIQSGLQHQQVSGDLIGKLAGDRAAFCESR
jgi:hypothetical protein